MAKKPNAVDYNPLIRDLPAQERPRERLKESGASSLSNAELLAIILRVGSRAESVLNLSTRMLARFGGLGGLSRAGFAELKAERGVGEAKACQVKAALELGLRLASIQPDERASVSCPSDVARLLQAEMGLLEQEEMRVVLLNTKNQVMGVPRVYRGNVAASVIRVSELFREAIRENCPAVIIVHNHPSGDPTPSDEDVRVTRQIIEGGKVLDIEVLDHLVIGQQRFVSLKEKGLGFK